MLSRAASRSASDSCGRTGEPPAGRSGTIESFGTEVARLRFSTVSVTGTCVFKPSDGRDAPLTERLVVVVVVEQTGLPVRTGDASRFLNAAVVPLRRNRITVCVDEPCAGRGVQIVLLRLARESGSATTVRSTRSRSRRRRTVFERRRIAHLARTSEQAGSGHKALAPAALRFWHKRGHPAGGRTAAEQIARVCLATIERRRAVGVGRLRSQDVGADDGNGGRNLLPRRCGIVLVRRRRIVGVTRRVRD